MRAHAYLLAIAVVTAHAAVADDLSIPKREIAASSDFRVRMASALALGRSRDPSVRPLLEQALTDSNAAVRTAAAAALGALGDAAAVPALERAKAHEPAASTRAQMQSTIASLGRRATLQGVQLVVQIGAMRNGTGIRGGDVAEVLRSAATSRARTMHNIVVAAPEDSAMLATAADRHVPVVLLDGRVTRLTQVAHANVVTCQADVEFVVRKIPDQTLRSTLSGSAAAMGSGATSQHGVATLQDQAIGGAVESALRNADEGLLVAAR
ncbi:MAG TPA: HEAT repeat domain-containing protein [Polyangiaceae bacterium]